MSDFFSKQLATHLRQVFFGGNWTCVNVKDTLDGIDCQMAQRIGHNGHSIAKLTYHIHYFVAAVLPVLEGGDLTAHDVYSFDCPAFADDLEWRSFVTQVFNDVENCAALIENVEDDRLTDNFVQTKYGNVARNFLGLIEHTHYHLAQISDLKRQWLTEPHEGII